MQRSRTANVGLAKVLTHPASPLLLLLQRAWPHHVRDITYTLLSHAVCCRLERTC